MRKGLIIIFSLFMAGMSFPSSTASRIFGGDLELGCPIDSLDALIIDGGGYHNSLCEQALKDADPQAKVAFFPWDLYPAAAMAESLGIMLVVPVTTSEVFGYYYVAKNDSADFLLSVTMGQCNASDRKRGYFPNPQGLGKYSICSTVADSSGRIIGSYGPTVDFPEYWSKANLRSFVMSYQAGKISYIRRRAKALGIKLTWQETRQVCYMLASEGAVDSLGRRESFRGVIDISNAAKVDSAIFAFETQKRFAAVSAQKILPEKFSLSQNYPNPFNPTTTVEYELDAPSYVCLTIFNFLGQEVEKVVDEFQTSGPHRIIWNASSYPNGIYYCRLEKDGGAKIIKMTLLK